MDITQVYIKMCEKAKAIQKLWKPQGGDYYLHNYRNTTGFDREQEKQIWGDANEKWQKVEILCYRPMEDRDWFVSTADGVSHVTSVADMVRHGCIWLPRQDQLQEMMGLGIQATYCTLDSYINWNNMFNHSDWGGYTWERLWLEVVMKEKYNKVWNGEDWVE